MRFDALFDEDFEVFATFLDKVDVAIEVGSCALYYDSTYQLNNLDLFSRNGTEFAEDEFDLAREKVDALDNLMVFALGNAPEPTVRRWAANFVDEEKVGYAVRAVSYIREKMPNLHQAWDARRSRLGPAVGDLTAHVVIDPSQTDFAALVRFDSFIAAGQRLAPVDGSRQFFDVRMTRNDLLRAISTLSSAVGEIEHYRDAVNEGD